MSRLTILGVGVDLVDVKRLAAVRARRDIMRMVCAPEERLEKLTDLGAAKLWCGKEAVAKCLSTGLWQKGIDWSDIVIIENQVNLRGNAAAYGARCIFSLDYTRNGSMLMAVAMRWAAASGDEIVILNREELA